MANLKYIYKVSILLISVIAVLLIGSLIFDIYFYRGRTVDFGDEKITLGSFVEESYINENFKYRISQLPPDKYIVELENTSIEPYLFWLYEYPNWGNSLMDSIVIKYARRFKIYSKGGIISNKSFAQFDCGSGLGVSIIRPYEYFRDTLTSKELFGMVNFRSFFKVLPDNKYLNKITGSIIEDKNISLDSLSVNFQDLSSDSLDIEFILPVISYMNYKHSIVVSNKMKIHLDKINN
jgi:hypothetical protein